MAKSPCGIIAAPGGPPGGGGGGPGGGAIIPPIGIFGMTAVVAVGPPIVLPTWGPTGCKGAGPSEIVI